MLSLTEKQIAALRAAAAGPISPWDHGSTTIAVLKRYFLVHKIVENRGTKYIISENGRTVLAALAPSSGVR